MNPEFLARKGFHELPGPERHLDENKVKYIFKSNNTYANKEEFNIINKNQKMNLYGKNSI